MLSLAELVISHKENPRKCTLTPFRTDPRFRVIYHRPSAPVRVEGKVLLHPDGPPLAAADVALGLVLVDGSWKTIPRILRNLEGDCAPRSLPPGIVSAYPRAAKDGTDPVTGLASIEALYAALWIGGRAPDDLLAHYHWRERFLADNAAWFAGLRHSNRP